MPSGPPVLLTACSTAEPTPLLSADSSTSAADMAVAMAMPVPSPATAIHAATYRPPELTLVIAPATSPAASSTNPAATATLAPTRRTMRDAGKAPAISPPTRGSSRRPEPIAVVPSTPWKYCGMVNKMPSMAHDRHHGEDHAPGERGRAEQRQIDQRLAAGPAGQPALPAEEADQQRHAGDHQGQGAGIAPAVLAGLDQAVGQRHQPGGRGRHPDEVQARALRRRGTPAPGRRRPPGRPRRPAR